MALFSICVSVLTIAFASTTISYDLDVDPVNRSINPKFYGAVPNSSFKRSLTFFTMFFFTVLSTLSKVIGCAFMAATSIPFFLILVFAELCLSLILKLVRQDFLYWFPIGGWVAVVISLFQRIGTQVCTGCTAMLQLRHHYELGGAWWSATIIWSHLGSYVSVWYYSRNFDENVVAGEQFDADELYNVLFVLSGLWVCTGSFLIFYCLKVSE